MRLAYLPTTFFGRKDLRIWSAVTESSLRAVEVRQQRDRDAVVAVAIEVASHDLFGLVEFTGASQDETELEDGPDGGSGGDGRHSGGIAPRPRAFPSGRASDP